MKQTKYPVERIIQILSEAELPGNSIAEVCRKYSISRSTFEKWRQKFKGMRLYRQKGLRSLRMKISGSSGYLQKNSKQR